MGASWDLGPGDGASVVAGGGRDLQPLGVLERLRLVETNVEVAVAAPAARLIAGPEGHRGSRGGADAGRGDEGVGVVVVGLELQRELNLGDPLVFDDRF